MPDSPYFCLTVLINGDESSTAPMDHSDLATWGVFGMPVKNGVIQPGTLLHRMDELGFWPADRKGVEMAREMGIGYIRYCWVGQHARQWITKALKGEDTSRVTYHEMDK